jgi:hypothetical protein
MGETGYIYDEHRLMEINDAIPDGLTADERETLMSAMTANAQRCESGDLEGLSGDDVGAYRVWFLNAILDDLEMWSEEDPGNGGYHRLIRAIERRLAVTQAY